MNELDRIIEKIEFLLNLNDKVDLINKVRECIYDVFLFKDNLVDFVKWELSDNVVVNDYNLNKVVFLEMEFLEVSIMNDGYI